MNQSVQEGVRKYAVMKRHLDCIERVQEDITIERPLEIRLSKHGMTPVQLAITMRTPGHDTELALGFMYSEGIIASIDDVDEVENISDDIILIKLSNSARFSPNEIKRRLYVSSSCGACGKSSISDLEYEPRTLPWFSQEGIAVDVIQNIADTMRSHQSIFQYTGGLHAAALFKVDGTFVSLREDVGRHNALDKLVGSSIGQDLKNHVVMLSGRTSFELVQKAAMMGISILVSIGPPSSLALDTADAEGITLIGFLKEDSMNVYTHPQRVQELSKLSAIKL